MSNYYNRQWRLPNNENKDKQSNYSMEFDGSSYINAGNDSGLAISGNFTISLWVNQTTTTAFSYLLDKGGAGSNINYRGGINSSNQVYFQINGNSLTSTGTITNGTWSHIVLVKSGTSMNIYIDNNAETPATAPATAYTGTENLEIGRQTGGANYLNGKIDGVAIFDYALSSSQITTLYGSSSTGIGNPMSLSPKPVAYYPLGDQDVFNSSSYLVPNSSLKDYVFDFIPNDYIDCGTGLGNTLGSSVSDMTVSLWYKNQTGSNEGLFTIMSSITSGTTAPFAISYNTNSIYVWFGSNYNYYSQTLDSNWHHLSIVKNGTSLTTYIDGSSVSPSGTVGSIPATIDTTNKKTFIGVYYNASFTYNGSLSNAQVFNTALPATGSNSIETLYNNGSPLTSMSGFTSLQGWWKLDASATYDSSTTTWSIPDDSTNSNTGTSSGMTQANLVQSDLSFTSGYSPYALDFDGTDDVLTISNENNFDFDRTDSFSISCWFKCDNVSVTNYLINKYSASGSYTGYYLFVNSGGQLKFYLRNHYSPSNQIIITSSTNIVNDVWYNFIITYDGSSNASGCKIYINASDVSQINTDTLSSSILNDEPLRIGGRSPASDMANGSMSNVSVWNAALTSSQVSEIYNEGVPSNLNNHSAYSNLVSWWQLGSNSSWVNPDWTVLDEKGSNNGTSSNMDEDAIVDGVGSYANGLGTSGLEVIGSAFGSSANSLSVNMDVLDRTDDIPA